MHRAAHFLALSLGAAFVACAASTGPLEQELSHLRREVRTMKQQNEKTAEALQKLEGQLTLLSLADAPKRVRSEPSPDRFIEHARAPKVRGSRSGRRSLPVVRIENESSRLDGRDFVGAIDDGRPPVVIELGPSTPRLAVDKQVLKKKDPILERSGDSGEAHSSLSPSREAYQVALDTLRNKKDAVQAALRFAEFQNMYPNSKLVDNAMYWLAECQYRLGEGASAVEGWTSLVERFPRSGKVPDALLRTGEVWLEQGQTAKGRGVLSRVTEAYPQSEAARGARSHLSRLSVESKE